MCFKRRVRFGALITIALFLAPAVTTVADEDPPDSDDAVIEVAKTEAN